ncbi:MAG: NFACT RNA binding domain-containing protein [Desulfovibrionaceae bacterium]
MDAGFFRYLAAELASRLAGRRIETVFGPADDTWTFRLDRKQYLIYRPARSAGLLFLTALKPVNPPQAPARVMYYRKRLAGRRILGLSAHWPTLRLGLRLTPRPASEAGPAAPDWLLMDLRGDPRDNPSLAETPPPDFAEPPAPHPDWPELPRILDDPEVWREFPHISPPLRRHLARLAPPEARALLDRLRRCAPGPFFLADAEAAIPLPWAEPGPGQAYESAAEAARAQGERRLFALLEAQAARPETDRLARARKKVLRTLARLDTDEAAQRARLAAQTQAEALQANLWRFSPPPAEPLPELLDLEHPTQGPVPVPLDPRRSPAENMQQLFVQAGKARRGLGHIARRREELTAELARLDAGTLPAPARPTSPRAAAPKPQALPGRFRGLAVQLFTSSDGLLLARGKNKQANHDLVTKAASPFDLWLHVADGPSSHVLVKRDSPDQPVPETTLREAAGLCALKSHRSDDARADVMVPWPNTSNPSKAAPQAASP